MRRWNAVSPIVFAFICGYHLPELAWKIDSGAGVHSATDLAEYLIVGVSGIVAVWGAWRAFRSAEPAPSSK